MKPIQRKSSEKKQKEALRRKRFSGGLFAPAAAALLCFALSSPAFAAPAAEETVCQNTFQTALLPEWVKEKWGHKETLEKAAVISRIQLMRLGGDNRASAFTREQGDAVYKAHLIGQGEKGEDGSLARPGNYTAAQLKAKQEALRAVLRPWEADYLVSEAYENSQPSLSADLSSQEKLALGQTVGEFINYFAKGWRRETMRRLEELRMYLGADSEAPLAELVSKAALANLIIDLEKTKGFAALSANMPLSAPIIYLSPEDIEKCKRAANWTRKLFPNWPNAKKP